MLVLRGWALKVTRSTIAATSLGSVFEVVGRLVFLRMSAAVLVHTRGCLRSFQPLMKARILALRSRTERTGIAGAVSGVGALDTARVAVSSRALQAPRSLGRNAMVSAHFDSKPHAFQISWRRSTNR